MAKHKIQRRAADMAAAAILGLVIIITLLLPTSRAQACLDLDQTVNLEKAAHPEWMARQAQAADPEQNTGSTDAETEETEEPENPEVLEKEKPEGELSATEILAGSQIIAHAMGAIDDLRTPNCLEGFLAQYEAGVRVFEADLRLTRDVKNVLHHDWYYPDWQDGISYTNIPTREKFVSEKILDKYTPLSFQDLLLLMVEYPDICVVTDTKFTEPDVFYIQFDSLLADAHELGLTYLLDRIFVQVYDERMHTGLENIHPFPHYIYTLYQDKTFDGTEDSFREKAAYCAEHGIEGITMSDYWWKPAYAGIAEEYGIKVYVHTINDADKAKEILSGGAAAIYSDSLAPANVA